MSTKAYLSAIALAVAGTAFAADVTSQNIVGYHKATAPKGGFAIIANQLDNGSGNKVGDLIKAAPLGTTLYKFNGNFVLNSSDGESWDDANQTLNPGEAAFVYNPTAADQTFTFVGEVKGINGDTSFAPTLKGKSFSLVSSVVPVDTAVADLGITAKLGDTIYTFVSGNFALNSNDGTGWDEPTAKINVGSGFFFYNAQAADNKWTRSFTVN